MKKEYALFYLDDEEYVIRFKIKGSLAWNDRFHCFEDDRFYVRTVGDLVGYSAFNTHPENLKTRHSFWAYRITHEEFKEYRARGVKRYKPVREVIDWG